MTENTFRNKVVIVTGGANGIGNALQMSFVRKQRLFM